MRFEPCSIAAFAWFSGTGATLRREQRDLPHHRYRACGGVSRGERLGSDPGELIIGDPLHQH